MIYEIHSAVDYNCVDANKIIFSSPAGKFAIADHLGLISRVLACCARGQDVDAAFSDISEDSTRQLVKEQILDLLLRRRILTATGKNARQASDPFLGWLGYVGMGTASGTTLLIEGNGFIADTVKSTAVNLGIEFDTAMPEAWTEQHLIIYCQDQYDLAQLRSINRHAVASRSVLLPVSTDRYIINLGPIILPKATACIECLYHREKSHTKERDQDCIELRSETSSEFVCRMAAMFVLEEAARYMLGAAYDLHAVTLTRHSVLTGKRTKSVAWKIPRCAVCGSANGEAPLVKANSAKVLIEEGAS